VRKNKTNKQTNKKKNKTTKPLPPKKPPTTTIKDPNSKHNLMLIALFRNNKFNNKHIK